MAGVQIPVDANISALQKKIEALGRKIEEINNKKWTPVDPAAVERDARKVEQTLDATRERINKPRRPRPSGTVDPAEDEPDFARRTQYGLRKRYTYAPDLADIPRGALSGFGGGLGQVVGAGTRGAIAGSTGGGGALGGVAGLLKGTAIGALAFGAFKAASAVSEGMDMARERAGTLDTLKRQMGDVGISFERLKLASDSAAYGLGINSKDFAALEQQMNVASRGADRDPMGLFAATSTAAGFARSYGMDPGAAANIFGGAKNIDQRQNYRQFAMILAETIEKSGMASRADEVAQAVLSFGQLASRLSLSAPNYNAFGGAYSGMVGSGITGLTPELAAQILGQANAAMSNMGASGESGQAFTLAAFQHSGRGLNPLEASAQASGGLFGTRASVFGPNTAMASLLGDDAKKLASGPGAETTNFQMIRDQARRLTGDTKTGKELQAEMLQRYFGLQSLQQAAVLMTVGDQQGGLGGFSQQLQKAGIDPTKMNMTNIQTMAKISGAKGMGGLEDIYADLKTRTGTSALTREDTTAIDKAKGQGEEAFRTALFTAANGKDQTVDMATTMRDSKAILDTIATNTGDTLLKALTGIQDDMITMMGGKKSLDEGRQRDAEYTRSKTYDAAEEERRASRKAIIGPMNAAAQLPTGAQMQQLRDIDAKADMAEAWADVKKRDTLHPQGPQVADPLGSVIVLHNHVKLEIDRNGNVKPIEPSQITVPKASGAH